VTARADPGATISFRPLNVGRVFLWGGTALVLLLLPLLFRHGFALTLLSQMGLLIIFALSYNMLLGQSGMLSFGHAVYAGLGAFFSIHALNLIGAGTWLLPVSLLPLVGGVSAALVGVVFGYVTTQRAGTPFAMITLGIGEMVAAASLMLPGFFGGEGGITGNRTIGAPLFGIRGLNLGSQLQVYYLIACWCLVSMAAMYALTQTPLGRIANAVRDNPERAQFIGYNPQRVRWLMLVLSSFFAGVSGALTAINFEIVSAENVGAARSGAVLLATFMGGAAFFFGPILGAIVIVLFAVALSEISKAWLLYLGLAFVLQVMFAPGGLASLVLMNLRVIRLGRFRRLRDPYLGVLATAAVLIAGVVLLIEITYHHSLDLALGPTISIAGLRVDTTRPEAWAIALTLLTAGAAGFAHARRGLAHEWSAIAQEIEHHLRQHPVEPER